MDSLIEIDNNGRKTTFGYLNGFQVYCDNDDEIIVDNQTHNVLKIKKYVHQGTIDQNTTFMANPFVARDLITNDMYEYVNNFTTTKITDRIKKDLVTLEFDDQSNLIKQFDTKDILYNNYDAKDRLISSIKMKNDSNNLLPDNDYKFKESNNEYSLFINSSKIYSNKTNAFCLKAELNDYCFVNGSSSLKEITLSVYYTKSNEKYNFKQIFPIKENDVLVLPFFLEGSVSNFEAHVESNLSCSEMMKRIKKVTINEIKDGILQEYDEKDRLWKIKTNEGKTTYLVFDDKLPIHVEFKDWNGKAVTTDNLYDTDGKLVNSVDSKGNCESYLYQNGGKKVEKKVFNLNDASLVRSEISEYDVATKTYLEKGSIKDEEGNYPDSKTIFYPGTNIVKTEIAIDGTKTEYIINPRNKKLVGLIKENNGVKNSISYVYNGDFLTSVKNNGTTVNYTYDGSKRIKTIRINGYSYTFISNTYSKDPVTVYGLGGKSYVNGSTVTTSFNGGIFKATSSFDKNSNLVRLVQTDNSNIFTSNYLYSEDNLLTNAEIIKTGDNPYKETNSYVYNAENKVISFVKEVSENETPIETVKYTYTYASNKNLTKADLIINGQTIVSTTYSYNADKLLTKEVINSKYSINYEYDALNRVNHQEIKNDNNLTICRYFSYLQQDGNTLDLIAEDNVKVVSSTNGYLIENRKYSYDVNGRIIGITIDNKKISYEYDASGRLSKEHNEVLGIENKYAYDTLGNIISKKKYDLVSNSLLNEDELIYSCDGRHLLVSINNTSVATDVYGRITSYNGKSLTWNKNGSLKGISLANDYNIEYAYNDKGIRYHKKSSDGVVTRFILNDTKILKEESINHCIDYLYSTSGLFGFKYNGETYLYEKNVFGDIVRIYNNDGEMVGEYAYDAVGNVTIAADVNGIATINPFRYRGYYYDSDTGLYYLNYRYYDPNLGRFISPDDASYINPNNVNGLNIYAYCNNDPINNIDPTGHTPEWLKWLIGGVLIACAIAVSIVAPMFLSGAVAAVLGTSLGASIAGGAIVGGVVGAATGALMSAGTQIIKNGFENFSFAEVGIGALSGLVTGAIAGGIFGAIKYFYSAETLATVTSDLESATNELDNSMRCLGNIKDLSKLPFAGSNIAKTVGQAAINYNNAYVNFIMAKVNFVALHAGFRVLYFVGETYLSDRLGKYVNI